MGQHGHEDAKHSQNQTFKQMIDMFDAVCNCKVVCANRQTVRCEAYALWQGEALRRHKVDEELVNRQRLAPNQNKTGLGVGEREVGELATGRGRPEGSCTARKRVSSCTPHLRMGLTVAQRQSVD